MVELPLWPWIAMRSWRLLVSMGHVPCSQACRDQAAGGVWIAGGAIVFLFLAHMTLEPPSKIARRAKGLSAMIRRICVAVLLVLLTTGGAVVVSAGAAGAAAAFAGDALLNE
jgi:hypothetical protein